MMQSSESETIDRVLGYVRSIAVIGLSSDPVRPSYTVTSYMVSQGMKIVPVNPHETEVFGVAAVDSLNDIEGEIDVVNVFRRPAAAPQVARLAVEKGARALWMQPGAENDLAAEIAREAGLDVVSGPCLMVQHKLWSYRQRAAQHPNEA
ncbi:MAG: CoA-binding protein [Chloroflexi bacterium]|nr:CoA-binding protein [Chloroflexota bacterium]